MLVAWKADSILVCTKSGVASRQREGTVHIHSALEDLSGVLDLGLMPPAQDKCGAFGGGPEQATKMIRGLKCLSFEYRLKE